jgi:hypothetical protein
MSIKPPGETDLGVSESKVGAVDDPQCLVLTLLEALESQTCKHLFSFIFRKLFFLKSTLAHHLVVPGRR